MEYQIHILKNRNELKNCPIFSVDQFNWGGDYRPKTWGQLGFLPKVGYLVHMVCAEKNPVCRYQNHFDPVWTDSAMEAFFAFGEDKTAYFNLEVNSAGAVVASYGRAKTQRKDLTLPEVESLECSAQVGQENWSITLLIPLSLIFSYCGRSASQPGERIRMNFYKIAEGSIHTHFASYSPIIHPVPNFHLPEYFADGILTENPLSES